MIEKNPALSVMTITAMGIVLLLSFSFVTYPLGLTVKAQTEHSKQNPIRILKLNQTVLDDPLRNAVLTLSDGTNILNEDLTFGPPADSSGTLSFSSGVTSFDSDSDSSSDASTRITSLNSGSEEKTGELGSTTGELGSTTGELGSTTGELGSTTGELG